MSVTADVSHVEMWPYVASAASASESQRRTAMRIKRSSAIKSRLQSIGIREHERDGGGLD